MKRPLATLLLLAAAPLSAAEFSILLHETPDSLALRSRADAAGSAYWTAFADYGAALGKAGVLRGGMPLQPRAETAIDGNPLGGFFLIDVADQAAADAWARRAPVGTGRAIAVPAAASPAMAAPTASPASR